MPIDVSQVSDLLTVASPLVVLVVTLAFTRGENRKQRDADWLQRQSEVRRAACAAVLAECERFNAWYASDAVQLYEGPEPEPWDLDRMVAPLRAAVVQAELVCSPAVVQRVHQLLDAALEAAADTADITHFETARLAFIDAARDEVGDGPNSGRRAQRWLGTRQVRNELAPGSGPASSNH